MYPSHGCLRGRRTRGPGVAPSPFGSVGGPTSPGLDTRAVRAPHRAAVRRRRPRSAGGSLRPVLVFRETVRPERPRIPNRMSHGSLCSRFPSVAVRVRGSRSLRSLRPAHRSPFVNPETLTPFASPKPGVGFEPTNSRLQVGCLNHPSSPGASASTQSSVVRLSLPAGFSYSIRWGS